MSIWNNWWGSGQSATVSSSGTGHTQHTQISSSGTGGISSVTTSTIAVPPGITFPQHISTVQPLSTDEKRRLEELEREYIDKRKQARVNTFKALPAAVRAKIVLDRQVYDAETAVINAPTNVTQTTEHDQLRARDMATKYNLHGLWPNQLYPPGSIGHWHNGSQYQPYPIEPHHATRPQPVDLGLTTEELERAHLDQCAEEMICEK